MWIKFGQKLMEVMFYTSIQGNSLWVLCDYDSLWVLCGYNSLWVLWGQSS